MTDPMRAELAEMLDLDRRLDDWAIPNPRDHVVVVFGVSGAESHCDLSHCPMHAHGPYTREEAVQAAERMPEWMQPHILSLAHNGDACLRAGTAVSGRTD